MPKQPAKRTPPRKIHASTTFPDNPLPMNSESCFNNFRTSTSRKDATHDCPSNTSQNFTVSQPHVLQGHQCRPQTLYTHACTAWEKGTVENVNRHIRRFYPKGTDVHRVSPRQVADLHNFINSVPRPKVLQGKTAHDTFFATAKNLAH